MIKTSQKMKHTMAAAAMFIVPLGLPQIAMAGGNAHMRLGDYTSQPIGHYEYCKVYTNDCRLTTSNKSEIRLTRERWRQIVNANAKANHSVSPVTDRDLYHVEELWAYPKGYGDCEDYALLKRKILMDQGWPPSSLLLTVVRQSNGEGHAVLTVRTDRADYILDNFTDKVKPWNETDYTFVKRQAWNHSGEWQQIDDKRLVVGSLRRK